ncbi:TPA: ShlB/FhaC/HecB family hemolysin secretion/activation protein [Pasteurella multocida]|nr:ShlB/FhaC/HecB family hemolysin secretion/activation protein [Pasteurella multocida]HDR1614849.1 ShlB/FhaC/HecB family hemolysin secretion/activation protein [Pasteurella multocida]
MLLFKPPAKVIFSLLFILYSNFSLADNLQAESIRIQQQQKQLENVLSKTQDIYLSQVDSKQEIFQLGQHETPCFAIQQFNLVGEKADQFSFLLNKIIKKSQFKSGMCLGTQSIQYLQTLAQNIVIDEGLVTTQLYIAPQDLTTGTLRFSIEPGYIGKLKFNQNGAQLNTLGQYATFPVNRQKILILSELEQGLENLRRLSGVEATIRIEPATDMLGESNVIVERYQPKSWFLTLGVNDAGSKTTGKYQGNISLQFNNLLGINDLVYVGYNQDLGHHKVSYVDRFGKKTDSGTQGYSLHYSVPFGYWLWSINHSYHTYNEATEGYYVNYDYSGKTYNTNMNLNRLIFRHKQHKTTLGMKLWRLRMYKYIDDAEIEVQRRQMGGWEANLAHHMQLGRAIINANVSYKRGTGIFNSQPAPEEFNDEHDAIPGTSRMKIINATLDIAIPFQLFKQPFSLDSSLALQWNKTPLIPQDKLSIGGRYTVRGFDGGRSLSGEKGWYWQNNVNWHYLDHHRIYFGVDVGRVSGRSTQGLPEQKLVGAVIGVTGHFLLFNGQLQYQFSLAKPCDKPTDFRTAATTYGLNLSYRY